MQPVFCFSARNTVLSGPASTVAGAGFSCILFAQKQETGKDKVMMGHYTRKKKFQALSYSCQLFCQVVLCVFLDREASCLDIPFHVRQSTYCFQPKKELETYTPALCKLSDQYIHFNTLQLYMFRPYRTENSKKLILLFCIGTGTISTDSFGEAISHLDCRSDRIFSNYNGNLLFSRWLNVSKI